MSPAPAAPRSIPEQNGLDGAFGTDSQVGYPLLGLGWLDALSAAAVLAFKARTGARLSLTAPASLALTSVAHPHDLVTGGCASTDIGVDADARRSTTPLHVHETTHKEAQP